MTFRSFATWNGHNFLIKFRYNYQVRWDRAGKDDYVAGTVLFYILLCLIFTKAL